MKPKTFPTSVRLTVRQRDALLRESVARRDSQNGIIAAYCDRLAKRHASDDQKRGA